MRSVQVTSRAQGTILVALAALTWGTIGIAVSLLFRVAHTDALSIGFLRLAIAAPVLLMLSRVLAGPHFLRVAARDRWVMVLIGGALALYQVSYFVAITYIGVAAAVLINICSAPIFIALLAGWFLREQVTRIVLVALLVAICGTALLIGGPSSDAAFSPIGVGLALCAGLSYAVVAVGSRAIAQRYHPVQPIAISFTIGAACLLPIALWQGLVMDYPALGWILLLHLGLIPTALGYILYLWGLRTTPATVSAVLSLLEPLLSTLLAVAFLGESLAPRGLVGGMLLLGSVVVLYMQSGTAALEQQ